MTYLNESHGDRAARMIGGMLLLATAWALSWNAFAIPLFAVGGMLLATGIVGWCPAYTLFGMSTVKTPAGPCPHCQTACREPS
jgi:Protein of unknown function (DUF2892)